MAGSTARRTRIVAGAIDFAGDTTMVRRSFALSPETVSPNRNVRIVNRTLMFMMGPCGQKCFNACHLLEVSIRSDTTKCKTLRCNSGGSYISVSNGSRYFAKVLGDRR